MIVKVTIIGQSDNFCVSVNKCGLNFQHFEFAQLRKDQTSTRKHTQKVYAFWDFGLFKNAEMQNTEMPKSLSANTLLRKFFLRKRI